MNGITPDPSQYSQQLNQKLSRFFKRFCAHETPAPEIYTSMKTAFRMRCEFRVWHQGSRCFYAMFEKGEKNRPLEINEFPVASLIIQQAMPLLLESINNTPLLKDKLFQVEFLSSSKGELLVTLVYHKPLDDNWLKLAAELEQQLSCHIIGRSRKQRLVLSQDFIYESFLVNDQQFTYQQLENSFTQPNASMNRRMLEWAVNIAAKLDGDLLELYCGNGNFTLPLSQHFEKVLATEMSKPGIRSATHNQEINKVSNISLARLRAEEVTQALQGKRQFRRLENINLDDFNFSTIFVDPPRAGVDINTIELMTKFQNIIYISCNPESLLENIEQLGPAWRIEKIAVFDQFPYSDHLESGVYLTRRQGSLDIDMQVKEG